MKTALVISLIVFIGLIAIILHKTPETAEISVLKDITSEHLAQPKSNEVINLINLTNNNKWNGVVFRFSNVTDVSYLPVQKIKIEAENEWLSNELERSKSIEEFNTGVKNILTNSEKDSIGRNHTSVYTPIQMELERLYASKADKRILVVYSDLMENNLEESLYSKGKIRLSQIGGESLKLIFENAEPLPDLNGVHIYLIYQPVDAEMDREYKIISEFYRKLLESKGAKVNIGANLQI